MTVCFVGGDLALVADLPTLEVTESVNFLPPTVTPVDLEYYNDVFAWLYAEYYHWAKRNPESLEWVAYRRVCLTEFDTLDVDTPLAWFQRTLQRQLGVDSKAARETLKRRVQGLRNICEYLTVIMPGRVYATRKFLDALLNRRPEELAQLTQRLVTTKIQPGQTAKTGFVCRVVLPALFASNTEESGGFAFRLDNILKTLPILQVDSSYPGYFLNEDTGEQIKRVTTPTTRLYLPTKKRPQVRLVQVGVWGSTWSTPSRSRNSTQSQGGASTRSLIQKPQFKSDFRRDPYVPKPVEGEAEFAYPEGHDHEKIARSLRKPHFYARLAQKGKVEELIRYLSRENQFLFRRFSQGDYKAVGFDRMNVKIPAYWKKSFQQLYDTAFKAIDLLLSGPQQRNWLRQISVEQVCDSWAETHRLQLHQAQQLYQIYKFRTGAKLSRDALDVSLAAFSLTGGSLVAVQQKVLTSGLVRDIGRNHFRGYGYLLKRSSLDPYFDTLLHRTTLVYTLAAAVFFLLTLTALQAWRLLEE